MLSEDDLIQSILGDTLGNGSICLECDIQLEEFKFKSTSSCKIKKLVLNIIKLFWKENIFYMGEKLSNQKSLIFKHLISAYKNENKLCRKRK